MELGQFINEGIVLAANSRRPAEDISFDLVVAPEGAGMVVVAGAATHGGETLDLRPSAGPLGAQALTLKMIVRVTLTPDASR